MDTDDTFVPTEELDSPKPLKESLPVNRVLFPDLATMGSGSSKSCPLVAPRSSEGLDVTASKDEKHDAGLRPVAAPLRKQLVSLKNKLAANARAKEEDREKEFVGALRQDHPFFVLQQRSRVSSRRQS